MVQLPAGHLRCPAGPPCSDVTPVHTDHGGFPSGTLHSMEPTCPSRTFQTILQSSSQDSSLSLHRHVVDHPFPLEGGGSLHKSLESLLPSQPGDGHGTPAPPPSMLLPSVCPQVHRGGLAGQPPVVTPLTTPDTDGEDKAHVAAEGRQVLSLCPARVAEPAPGAREGATNTPPWRHLPTLLYFGPYFSQHLKAPEKSSDQ